MEIRKETVDGVAIGFIVADSTFIGDVEDALNLMADCYVQGVEKNSVDDARSVFIQK